MFLDIVIIMVGPRRCSCNKICFPVIKMFITPISPINKRLCEGRKSNTTSVNYARRLQFSASPQRSPADSRDVTGEALRPPAQGGVGRRVGGRIGKREGERKKCKKENFSKLIKNKCVVCTVRIMGGIAGLCQHDQACVFFLFE